MLSPINLGETVKKTFIKQILATALAASLAFTSFASNACTSFLLKGSDGGFVYGRTMEFGLPLKSQLTVMPRNLAVPGVGIDSKPGWLKLDYKICCRRHEWLGYACIG